MSVDALCQLHDVFVDKKRWCMQDKVGSSHVLENQNSEKEKILAFELSSNIEQRTSQQKVFEERNLDNQVDRTSVEVLCELHDVFVGEKIQNIEEPSSSTVNSGSILMIDVVAEDEILESHYTKPH
jgi:hypothetical protein